MSAPSLELVERKSLFSAEQLTAVQGGNIPNHIAIIPDGNRRWAKQNRTTTTQGHRRGADTFTDTMRAALEIGINTVSFYTFSTENWTRSPMEVRALMWLLETYVIEQREPMLRDGIRLQTIGNLSRLPRSLIAAIDETKKVTQDCCNIEMILAINYGSRDEICRAAKAMLEDYEKQAFSKEDVSEALLSRYFDTAPWGDPDLLIRTSGEKRISNFLLWQISYTELYLTDTLWPDFTPQHLLEAVENFQRRKRRLGE